MGTRVTSEESAEFGAISLCALMSMSIFSHFLRVYYVLLANMVNGGST